MQYKLITAFAALIALTSGRSIVVPLSNATIGDSYAVFQSFDNSDCSGDTTGRNSVIAATVNDCTSLENTSLQAMRSPGPVIQFQIKTFTGFGCQSKFALPESIASPVIQGTYKINQCKTIGDSSSKLIGVSYHMKLKQ
ncbi:hypothetical protein MIR68_006280 [Amoeboaphelidium protococcarum]|nr:hypothetical protein MIR68_006280 [Amoeboaphelidium protococcarum]